MNKLSSVVVSGAIALGISSLLAIPADAADLTNGSYQSCDGSGTWHFVNNQTGGAGAGALTATFSCDGGDTTYGPIAPSKVLNSTQHFYVMTDGDCTLISASTDIPGRLQLSDYDCTPVKEPPPKCDPKTEICK